MGHARAIASLLIVSASAAACTDFPAQGYAGAPHVAERVEYGVVEHIELYREGSSAPPGIGAVLGGIAGGVRLELEEVGEGELRVGDRVSVVNGRAYRA